MGARRGDGNLKSKAAGRASHVLPMPFVSLEALLRSAPPGYAVNGRRRNTFAELAVASQGV